MKTKSLLALCFLILHSSFVLSARSQGTDFTYQGRLNDGASSANGIYDVRFTIYDSSAGGSQQGPILTNFDTAVSNGLVTATLDFGAGIFNGQNRWLEIAVRTNGSGGFTTLSPRRRVTPVPYAIAAGSLLAPLTGSLLQGTYPGILTLNNGANSFSGNGAGLTGLNAASLTGTVADARLSANVALRAGGNAFTGNQTVAGGSLGIGTVALDRPLVVQADGGSELMSLKDNTGANRWHLNLQNGGLNFAESSVADGRLFLGTNGNVGLGTLAPDATLDVAGAIRTRSGGIVFPDGSIQTRAAESSTSPTTVSGYPVGTTVSVTLNGSPCTLDGPLTITGTVGVEIGHGTILDSGILYSARVRVKRVRPAGASDWATAFSTLAIEGSSTPNNPNNWFTLVVTVAQPGGATQSISFSQLIFNGYALIGNGGQLFEVADLIALSNVSPVVRDGSLPATTPSGELPGLSMFINGAALAGVALGNLPLNATATGTPLSYPSSIETMTLSDAQTLTLRANLSSGAGLLAWQQASYSIGSIRSIAVRQGGVTLVAASDALGQTYRLQLADDGLPIEELDVAFANVTLPTPEPPTAPEKETR